MQSMQRKNEVTTLWKHSFPIQLSCVHASLIDLAREGNHKQIRLHLETYYQMHLSN